MRAIDFLVEHQRLDEVNMSPSSLKMLVKSIGATAGMEFEMIVPNVSDPSDSEYENDYESNDERSSSWSNIEDFFMGGDGNNSRSDVRSMIESMQESFWEWHSEQQSEQWSNEGYDYLKDYIVNNGEFDFDAAKEEALDELAGDNPEIAEDDPAVKHRIRELLDEFVQEQWDNNSRIYDNAYEEFMDNHDGYDEGDWLDDNYRYMSDVYHEFGSSNDVYWPYQARVGGDEDIDNVAESFSDAIGRPCNASSDYHGVRKEGEYTVEPDGSLDPDDSDDTGLEFVSPPLPLTELVADLTDVVQWADSYGCYTNDSTGLHMNVSVPSFSNQKLDYTKLAILLGDDYILQQFGRQANTYCKSAIQKVRSNIGQRNAGEVENLLKMMKNGLAKEASKLIHSGYTDKYTSINTKTGYVEFRSPGGDWLNEDTEKLTNTLYRFVVALDAACDPVKYKEEYYKKLYKLLNPAGNTDNYSQMINDFAQYTTAVGGAPQKVVADFRRLALATLQQSRGKDTGSWWWNVAINGQRIEVVGDNPDDAWQSAITANREWERFNKKDAKIQRLRPFVDDSLTSKSNIQGKMQDGGIYKIFDTRGTLIAGDEYGSDQEALERAAYYAQRRGVDVVVKNQQGQEVGRASSSGTIINTNYRADDQEPAAQTNQGNWGIWIGAAERFARVPGEYPNQQQIPLRRFASREDAEQFLQQTREENPRMRTDVEVREIDPQQNTQQPAQSQQPAQQEPNFYIVDGNSNQIVDRYYSPDVNNSYQYFLRWKQQNDPQEIGNYRYGRLSHDTEARYRELAATQPVRQTSTQNMP